MYRKAMPFICIYRPKMLVISDELLYLLQLSFRHTFDDTIIANQKNIYT